MTFHQLPHTPTPAIEPFDATVVLPPYSVDPDAPLRFARAFAAELARTATERERAGTLPKHEVEILKSSGLVNLLIPEKFGGLGARIPTALAVLIEINRGDGSVGSLLGYHYTNSGVARLYDVDTDAEALERLSAQNRWFWGNISQPFARTLQASKDGENWRLNGLKYWNTGPSLADVTTVLAHRDGADEVVYGWIPARREGLTYRQDWDHLGLRLTDTVTIDFDNVELKAAEVFKSSFGKVQSFAPLYAAIGELYFASYYLGSAWGALDAARTYTLAHTRPAPGSGLAATQDPYILREYGQFWTELEAATAYYYAVAEEVQDGFDRRKTITPQERAVLGIKANAVRAQATRVGLEHTAKIHELTGARSTANSFGLDRFWRDIRTHTLHDNQHYKLRAIGDYVLNGAAHEFPPFA